MKYTFLLPAYKSKYLSDAIKSILRQTYEDFQIIVSDDKSPENIKQIVDSFSDHRICYQCNHENIGGERLVDHWNLLVNQCKSDYLIIASDDDIYHPEFLEKVNNLINKYPNVDIIRARVQRIDGNGEVISKEDIFEEYQTELEAINSVFCGNYIGCIGNYVFRASSLRNIGGFVYLPYAWFSDMLTAISMTKNGQANTAEILFNFRLSEKNISNTAKNKLMDKNKLNATMTFHKWMGDYLTNLNFTDNKLNRNLYNGIIKSYTHRAYSQCGDYSWALPVWRWSFIYSSLKANSFFSKGSFLKYFGISVINRVFI